MEGTIIENSLADKSVLDDLKITKTWSDEDWVLHGVIVHEDDIVSIQKALDKGPWYMHFWKGDDITVVYKDKLFHIKKSDKETWKDAIEYGKTLEIPNEQLDFLTE